jgi:hypothetical protein
MELSSLVEVVDGCGVENSVANSGIQALFSAPLRGATSFSFPVKIPWKSSLGKHGRGKKTWSVRDPCRAS